MPQTLVVYYCDGDEAPVLDWLADLRRKNLKAYAKCRVQIELLKGSGHDLRRPHADILRDEIYELRVKCDGVNYRILYFFNGQAFAVLAAACTKEKRVPDGVIQDAISRKKNFRADPTTHTREERNDAEQDDGCN